MNHLGPRPACCTRNALLPRELAFAHLLIVILIVNLGQVQLNCDGTAEPSHIQPDTHIAVILQLRCGCGLRLVNWVVVEAVRGATTIIWIAAIVWP